MNYCQKSLRASQELIKGDYAGSLALVTLHIEHLKEPLTQYVILVNEARLILGRAPRRLGVLVSPKPAPDVCLVRFLVDHNVESQAHVIR